MNRTTLLIVLTVIALSIAACATPTPTAAPPTVAPKPTEAPKPTVAPTVAPTAASKPAAEPTSALIRIVMKEGQSEARFRVREQLAGVSLPNDAVGATKNISGTLVTRADGTITKEQSKFRVDLRTLKSDQDRRDQFLRRNTLESDKFPFAEFVPIQVKGLTVPVKDGDLTFQLIGDLTVREVTKSVTWDVTGKLSGNQGTGTAKTSFNFAYFNLAKPSVPLVLSIEDTIKLELDLALVRE